MSINTSSSKGNILLICSVFPPEEVTSAGMAYDLALELSKNSKVTVLRPKPTRPAGVVYPKEDSRFDEFNCITIKSYTCPHSRLIGRFRESTDFGLKSAYYIIKHHKNIDYVYNDGWHIFGLFIVSFISRMYGIPYMVPIQDVYPESLLTKGLKWNFMKNIARWIISPLDRYTQKNADVVRTNNNEMAQYLSKTRGIPLGKYLCVYNWQNESDFENIQRNKIEHKNLIFSYVGSINVHSNVELIIRAFHKANIKNAVLKIYGGGNQCEACKAIAKELGNDHIYFDIVSRNDVPKIQSESDALILALPTGNGRLCMPSKLVSYMLSAKPVIASIDKDCASSVIIQDSKCGFVSKPDDIDELAECLVKMADLPDTIKNEMGARAYEYASNNLSKQPNLAKVVSAIYNSVN